MNTTALNNIALAKIGVSNGVVSLDENTLEALMGQLHYDHMLRATLRRFSWPFATKYASSTRERPAITNETLMLVGGPLWDTDSAELTDVAAWSATFAYPIGYVVRVGGLNYAAIATSTNQTPPNATYWVAATGTYPETFPDRFNPDWLYAYRWPTDCLFVRRMVTLGVGRLYHPSPNRFRIGRDAAGLLIVTDTPDAVIEYTSIDCDALWTDDLFIDAFTWRLAAAYAPVVSKNGMTFLECYRMYEDAFSLAATTAANEQQQAPDGDASWIRGR
jgi:hypothetical protein